MAPDGPHRQSLSATGAMAAAKAGSIFPTPIPFGKYYLLEKIATGGMAEVFKAKAFGVEGFERLVAVKKILSSIAEDTEFISMFIDEAKIAGRLNHANIAQIFDLGKADGAYFIALEYIAGQNARHLFERARENSETLGIDMACYIIMKSCEGLDYAHNKADSLGSPLNIVHRDVSPQNLLVSYEGEVKVIDFGIAKAAGKSTQTQVGILKGKFSYMSPEQVRGLSLDRRSDLFSLTICFYELLTSERLFLGESDFETLEKIRKVDVQPPSLYNPHIPRELEDIIMKGLAKDPNERYQTAHEIQEALQKFMFNQPIYYTNKDLATSMRAMFGDELATERKRLEHYQTLDLNTMRRHTGEIPALTKKPSAVARGSGNLDLYWDEEEAATTIYTDDPDDEFDVIEVLEYDEGNGNGAYRENLSRDNSPEARRARAAASVQGDAWDRIAAEPLGEPGPEVREFSLTPPQISSVPDLFQPNRSRAGLVITLVSLFVIASGAAAFWFLNRGDGISMVFQPQPSDVVVEILLDSQIIHRGTTPFTYEAATVGPHTITILADGYQEISEPLELVANTRYDIDGDLVPEEVPSIAVRINSTPTGARIWIDGINTDQATPQEFLDIPEGTHHLRLVADGYISAERDFTVRDQLVAIAENLIASPIQLSVRASVDGAIYWLSDQDTGIELRSSATVPDDIVGLDGQKTYLLIVEAPGHRRHTELIQPSSVREVVVEATLRENPQAVVVAENTSDGEPDESSNSSNTESSHTSRRDDDDDDDNARPPRDEPRDREPVVEDEPDEPEVAIIENGTLSVQSVPAAEVFIDGRSVGWTAVVNHELAPGSYSVRLVNDEFGLDHTETVRIRSGESERVRHRGRRR